MTIKIKLSGNIQNLMRQCGYFFEKPARNASHSDAGGENQGEMAFVRILGSSKSDYPRFHIYAKANSVPYETELNLHLDQKKPVYQGITAHSGEYDTEIVKREAERIKQILGS